MTKHQICTKKLITKCLAWLMIGVSMCACGSGVSWKEEVLLHDGSKLIIKRSQTRGGRHEIGQSPIKEHELSFTMPGTHTQITWKDEFSEEVGHSNFNLLMLDIFNGEPYIAVSSYGCLAYNKWGRPNPPYILFKYEGVWKRISMEKFPVGFKKPNLVINSSAHEKQLIEEDRQLGFVSATSIDTLNSSLSEFQTIARTPLVSGSLGVSCPEMVRIKGGWGSPGGAKAPLPIKKNTADE